MNLPNYRAVNFKENLYPEVLRTPAKKLTFPLNHEDLRDIEILERKFDLEENCAGLAAPQIGISKRIIVFSAPDSPELRKWRPDFTQTMEKTIWINPSYEGIGNEKNIDFEGCFSVINAAGNVARFINISYKAYDINGGLIEGEATGFLARIIQHEVDHINGILFINHVTKGELIDVEAYRKMRQEAIANGREGSE